MNISPLNPRFGESFKLRLKAEGHWSGAHHFDYNQHQAVLALQDLFQKNDIPFEFFSPPPHGWGPPPYLFVKGPEQDTPLVVRVMRRMIEKSLGIDWTQNPPDYKIRQFQDDYHTRLKNRDLIGDDVPELVVRHQREEIPGFKWGGIIRQLGDTSGEGYRTVLLNQDEILAKLKPQSDEAQAIDYCI